MTDRPLPPSVRDAQVVLADIANTMHQDFAMGIAIVATAIPDVEGGGTAIQWAVRGKVPRTQLPGMLRALIEVHQAISETPEQRQDLTFDEQIVLERTAGALRGPPRGDA